MYYLLYIIFEKGIANKGKDLSKDGNKEAHCHFEQDDKILVSGTYMNAAIEVKNNQAFTLPEEAIVHFENKKYIYKSASNNQFEMTEVTVRES